MREVIHTKRIKVKGLTSSVIKSRKSWSNWDAPPRGQRKNLFGWKQEFPNVDSCHVNVVWFYFRSIIAILLLYVNCLTTMVTHKFGVGCWIVAQYVKMLPRTSRTIAMCAAANFINAADRIIMPIAIVPMTVQYRWTLYWQGWILSSFAFGYITSQVCTIAQ